MIPVIMCIIFLLKPLLLLLLQKPFRRSMLHLVLKNPTWMDLRKSQSAKESRQNNLSNLPSPSFAVSRTSHESWIGCYGEPPYSRKLPVVLSPLPRRGLVAFPTIGPTRPFERSLCVGNSTRGITSLNTQEGSPR